MTPIRWGIAYFVLISLVAALGYYIMASSPEPWDGVYRCNPGGTYTLKECK